MDLPVSGRGRREERVPLDALVELRSENGDEVMEADGLDLGPGGLSMRAPFVPEPGVRLVCHFRCPPIGEPVEAHSEVVWSAWEGPRSGAFGVRFLELDTRGAMAIRRLLSPESEQAEGEGDKSSPTPEAATMIIDGLAAPIEADLRLFDETRIVLEQELTFLRLGRGVEVDVPGQGKQRGRIASVELRPGPLNVPTLVFGVLIDQPAAEVSPLPATVTTRAASLPVAVHESVQATAAAARTAAEPFGSDEPLPSIMVEVGPTIIVEGMDEVPAPPSSIDTWPERPIFTDAAALGANDNAAIPSAAPAGRDRVDETHTFAVHERSDDVALSPDDRAEVDAFSSSMTLPGVGSVWRQLATGLESIRVTLRTLFTMLRTLFVRHVGERANVTVRQVGTLLRSRSSRAETTKLRTTAPAPRTQKTAPVLRETRSVEGKPSSPRNHRLRGLALAVVGLGLGVYALAPRSGAKISPQPMARTESSQTVALLPSAGNTASSSQSASTSITAPVANSVTAPEPSAHAEPVAIGSGPTREQLGVTPPQAANTDGVSKAFGAAEVAEGRTFVLRMSGPVEGIEGDARDDGFTVRVPGRLALDRASPIATSHRAVARAMILNRGDYAELTVDFLPGMKPKYRVIAKDQAIEVTLERL